MGRVTAVSAAAFALAAHLVFAQPEISGYYEHTFQADYEERAGETLLDASKVRLELQSGGDDGSVEFRGNINVIRYHGDISYDVTPYLPDEIVRTLRLHRIPAEVKLDRQRIYLDNAFLTWRPLEHMRVRAGKQQLAWGPGYSINPTDLFHEKTLIDPTYEKEGVTALRLDYRWGIGGQLAAIIAPDDRFETSGYALRAGVYIPPVGYDVAITVHSVTDSTSLHPRTLLPRTQRREAVGLEFTGSLFGLGVWCEGNWNRLEDEQDFYRVVAGVDYTLESGIYLMGEVLYNGRANFDTPYPARDWLANLAYAEPVGPGWALIGTRYEFSLLVSGGVYGFLAPDGTGMLNPRLDISLAQNADLALFGAWTFGAEDGSFPPGLVSGIARATVYF